MTGGFEDVNDLERRFQRAPGAFERYMRRFLQRAVVKVEGEVKERTPVNVGRLRSSVTHEVRGLGAKMQGIVGSPVSYAPYVETGTKPHWPPFAPIMYWVQRKLRLSGDALYAATRGVQRAIARSGTQGKQMFEKGLEASQGWIAEQWVAMWGEAVETEL